MAEVAGDWVDIGSELPLRTRNARIRIVERSDGGVDIEVRPYSDGHAVLGQHDVIISSSGALTIQVPTHVRAGVR